MACQARADPSVGLFECRSGIRWPRCLIEHGRPRRRTPRRFAYKLSYVVLIASGGAAARLAEDFRTLGSLDRRFIIVSVLLQLPVLVCWLVVRPISLAAFAG